MSNPGNTTLLLQNYLEQARQGDPEALSQLLNSSYHRLQRLANRLRRDCPRLDRFADADDILQGASLRLMQALRTVPESVADYFRLAGTVIRHELIDLIRRYHGPHGDGANQVVLTDRSDSPNAGLDAQCGDSTLDPGRLAIWQEFHQAVGNLPAEERDVFNLLWYHELTQEEAAELLNISRATVRRRWMAARLYLQQELQDDLPETE